MIPAQLAREQMIKDQIVARGVSDQRVLSAMREVPRHVFVPEYDVRTAYADTPLPIGSNQTISQPYIVAFMTEAALLKGGEKVLEIGTGSGYQSAVLSRIAAKVYSMEIIEDLGRRAEKILKDNDYSNVHVKIADGYRGWPEHAPFDVILITAAPEEVPQGLLKQLKPGGRMIVPVGVFIQELVRITKTEKGLEKEELLPVRFVPMTGSKE